MDETLYTSHSYISIGVTEMILYSTFKSAQWAPSEMINRQLG